MRDEVEKIGGQRKDRALVVITRRRDNRDPFPGRITEVKLVKESASERAWRRYLRECQAARDARERAEWERFVRQFEKLADKAQETES